MSQQQSRFTALYRSSRWDGITVTTSCSWNTQNSGCCTKQYDYSTRHNYRGTNHTFSCNTQQDSKIQCTTLQPIHNSTVVLHNTTAQSHNIAVIYNNTVMIQNNAAVEHKHTAVLQNTSCCQLKQGCKTQQYS